MRSEIKIDEIRYSARKTLSMRITRRGELIISAPYGCPKTRIDAFVEDKKGWICKHKAEAERAAIPPPPENLDGYAFPILGRQTKIFLVEGNRVGYDKESGLLYLPKANARERLVKWLKQNAKRIFTEVTAKKAAEMVVAYKSVGISSARARWGSCSADKSVHYTFRLLYCPKEIVEYVVVHELAHTRHLNHSQAFWREVEKYLPDWKERRKWLKNHGALLELF